MNGQVAVSMAMEPGQALALAQLVKRIGWDELRQNAANDEEASEMREAIGILAKALKEVGYAPR